MLSVDARGFLVSSDPSDPAVRLVPAHPSRHAGRLRTPRPLGPVWHTTDVLTDAAHLADRWAQPLPAAADPSSAHVLVDRSGLVVQSVSLLETAWHVRGGGTLAGRRVDSLNRSSTGIEVCNAGRLRRFERPDGARFFSWPYFRDPAAPEAGPDPSLEVPGARVVQLGPRYYDDFPAAQLAALTALLRALATWAAWRPEDCTAGHVDYDPLRRGDPWPLFSGRYLPRIVREAFAVGPAASVA